MSSQPTSRARYKGRPVDVVLDVRSRLEFWFGHLDGAVCVPVDALAERVPNMPSLGAETRVLVYCASGARSAAAASHLRALGFRNVTDAGGMGDASQHYAYDAGS